MYVEVTVTTGGATCGNCEIGRVGISTSPASRITTEQTDAKIGRWRKKSIKERLRPAADGVDADVEDRLVECRVALLYSSTS